MKRFSIDHDIWINARYTFGGLFFGSLLLYSHYGLDLYKEMRFDLIGIVSVMAGICYGLTGYLWWKKGPKLSGNNQHVHIRQYPFSKPKTVMWQDIEAIEYRLKYHQGRTSKSLIFSLRDSKEVKISVNKLNLNVEYFRKTVSGLAPHISWRWPDKVDYDNQ